MRRSLVLTATAAALFVLVLPARAATDPYRSSQWALDRIQAEQAWKGSRGSGVVIAIVDTGIDLTHPDLKSKIVAAYTCIGGTCSTGGDDDNGHGSHVAGIAAAATGNGVGIAGVAPDARLMSVKVLDQDGNGDCGDVEKGVRWATDHHARVINLSLGPEIGLVDTLLGGGCVQELQRAAEYAWNKGSVVVIAAGNDSLKSVYSSSALEVVGATGPRDESAYYSSSGADIYAPGGDAIVSCSDSTCIRSAWVGNQYALEQGTSMAAPHVSGVAALLLARGYGNAQAVQRINSTADRTNGISRVNAARAVGGAAATSNPKQRPSGGGTGAGSGSAGGSPPGSGPGSGTPSATAPAAPSTAKPGAATPAATGSATDQAATGPQASRGASLPGSSAKPVLIAFAALATGLVSLVGVRVARHRRKARS